MVITHIVGVTFTIDAIVITNVIFYAIVIVTATIIVIIIVTITINVNATTAVITIFYYCNFIVTGVTAVRRNPPQVRATSGQRLCTKIIYIILQTPECATVLNIFSKEIISSNTKHRKRMLNFV